MKSNRPLLALALFYAVTAGSGLSYAAGSPFELDVKDLDASGGAKARPHKKEHRHTKKSSEKKAEQKREEVSSYTVKQGDFIYKILTSDYGMSSQEADARIPEIQALNKVDIRNLSVGQTILIPRGKHPLQTAQSESSAKRSRRRHARQEKPAAQQETVAVQAPPVQPLPENRAALVSLLLPARVTTPLTVGGRTLDPAEYQIFTAADGGTIIVDGKNALSEDFKKGAATTDPHLRFVSEDPADARKFLAAVLQKGGFAEVAADRVESFGESPRLSIRADFRVVMPGKEGAGQVVLLDLAPPAGFPSQRLAAYLAGKGVRLATPLSPVVAADLRRTAVVSVSEGSNPCERADALLDALKLKESPAAGKGILLRCTDSGAVDYTLERLLENDGYRVIRLAQGDDAQKIAETVLGKLKLPAASGKQTLSYGEKSGVTAEVEGFLVDRDGKRTLIVTAPLEPGLRDLLEEMEPLPRK